AASIFGPSRPAGVLRKEADQLGGPVALAEEGGEEPAPGGGLGDVAAGASPRSRPARRRRRRPAHHRGWFRPAGPRPAAPAGGDGRPGRCPAGTRPAGGDRRPARWPGSRRAPLRTRSVPHRREATVVASIGSTIIDCRQTSNRHATSGGTQGGSGSASHCRDGGWAVDVIALEGGDCGWAPPAVGDRGDVPWFLFRQVRPGRSAPQGHAASLRCVTTPLRFSLGLRPSLAPLRSGPGRFLLHEPGPPRTPSKEGP